MKIRCSYEKDVHGFFFKFLYQNFVKREGAYKKVVRMFDTLGKSFKNEAFLYLGLMLPRKKKMREFSENLPQPPLVRV